MKTQTIFNRVKKHLLKQNSQARIAGIGCRYLMDDGRKCAVGCLIKKKFYSPDLENESLLDARVVKALELSLDTQLTKEQINLLDSAQYIHDGYPPEKWQGQLQELAHKFKLRY